MAPDTFKDLGSRLAFSRAVQPDAPSLSHQMGDGHGPLRVQGSVSLRDSWGYDQYEVRQMNGYDDCGPTQMMG